MYEAFTAAGLVFHIALRKIGARGDCDACARPLTFVARWWAANAKHCIFGHPVSGLMLLYGYAAPSSSATEKSTRRLQDQKRGAPIPENPESRSLTCHTLRKRERETQNTLLKTLAGDKGGG